MRRIFFVLMCCLTPFMLYAQPIKLVFWHAMSGHLGDEVSSLVKDFNQSQDEYFIQAVYKGDYIETLTSFAASFRAHRAPSIVQIFEVGTAIMLSPKGVIKPLDDLMTEQGIALPKDDFVDSIREYYSQDGKLMAMPFNLSAPIIYYNADLLAKLGYNSTNFPATWAEMEILAQKIKKHGLQCTYTTAFPGWTLFESFLTIHGLPITSDNPIRAAYDRPELKKHFQRLQRWQKLGYFRYGGRVDEATIFFTSGVCPLFSQSSGAYQSLSSLAPFRIGVAVMPLDTEISKVRHANIAGGAALWAVSGQTEEQYRGIAKFFAFIAKPETQKRWHKNTGYLPIGLRGIYADLDDSKDQSFLHIVQKDLVDNLSLKPIKNKGPQNQIRAINDEVLESLFAGAFSYQEALHQSVTRANRMLHRFERNTVYAGQK